MRRLRPIKLVMDEGGLLRYWGWGLARATVAADAGLKSTEASEGGRDEKGRPIPRGIAIECNANGAARRARRARRGES